MQGYVQIDVDSDFAEQASKILRQVVFVSWQSLVYSAVDGTGAHVVVVAVLTLHADVGDLGGAGLVAPEGTRLCSAVAVDTVVGVELAVNCPDKAVVQVSFFGVEFAAEVSESD